MICDAFEVVAVPFPFTDSAHSVRRPALVLSQRSFNVQGHTLMAMITDARNPSAVLHGFKEILKLLAGAATM